MFIILSTLNQLNVEIRSLHRIHQLILSLDNILCPMCFKQQNIHLKLWFSLYGASPLEPKNSARTFLHFLFSQPPKSDYSDTTLCPTPLLLSQNYSHRTCTPIPPPPAPNITFISFHFALNLQHLPRFHQELHLSETPKHHNQGQRN